MKKVSFKKVADPRETQSVCLVRRLFHTTNVQKWMLDSIGMCVPQLCGQGVEESSLVQVESIDFMTAGEWETGNKI